MRRAKSYAIPEDQRGQQAAWWLLASLGIFFLASLLLFALFVWQQATIEPEAFASLRLPRSFIGSTLLLVGISWCLRSAVQAVRRDQFQRLQQQLVVAGLMTAAFLLLQSEGMWWLLTVEEPLTQAVTGTYRLIFLLAFLHAVHVLVGMVILGRVIWYAFQLRYDHERHWGVRFCGWYWHFLDGVWLVLLVAFVGSTWLLSS